MGRRQTRPTTSGSGRCVRRESQRAAGTSTRVLLPPSAGGRFFHRDRSPKPAKLRAVRHPDRSDRPGRICYAHSSPILIGRVPSFSIGYLNVFLSGARSSVSELPRFQDYGYDAVLQSNTAEILFSHGNSMGWFL